MEESTTTTNPLLEDSKEGEAEGVEAAEAAGGATSTAYRHMIIVAALAFTLTTLALAIVWPVKKHKFTTLTCVPREEVSHFLSAAAAEAAPVAWKAACAERTVDCSRVRSASTAAATAYCGRVNASGCDVLTAAASHGVPPLDAAVLAEAARRDGPREAMDAALAAWCDARAGDPLCAADGAFGTPTTNAAAKRCEASAACEAAKQFYESPSGYCADRGRTSAIRRHFNIECARRDSREESTINAFFERRGSLVQK